MSLFIQQLKFILIEKRNLKLRYFHEENYNLRVPRNIPKGQDEEHRKAFENLVP